MPKYLVTVKQTLSVRISVHAANDRIAATNAEGIVKGWTKTVDAKAEQVKEL
jgi:hypothetical protein